MKTHTMRKLILILILNVLFFSSNSFGQEFETAPLKGVKKITEWIQVPKSKKVVKGMTYSFNKKGGLIGYALKNSSGEIEEQGDYQYDQLNRMIAKEIIYGHNNTITKRAYKKNYYVEEVEHKDSKYKDFYYVDKKLNIIEQKSFIKSYDTEYKYQLFERTVFNYKKGKLIGKTHYNHWNVRRKNGKPTKKSTIYQYNKLGKITSIEERNYDGKPNNITKFSYDKKGNLIEKKLDYLNGKIETTSYKYKNGKLWVEEFDEGNVVIKKIYKNGKLIRKRKLWVGGKEEIIDYKFEFF